VERRGNRKDSGKRKRSEMTLLIGVLEKKKIRSETY